MIRRFIGDQILLTIDDGEGRDMSAGFSSLNIVVVRTADNTVVDTIPASAGGNGNKSIIPDRKTASDCFTAEGEHTYHVAATETGGETHTIGVGYLEIVAVPGT